MIHTSLPLKATLLLLVLAMLSACSPKVRVEGSSDQSSRSSVTTPSSSGDGSTLLYCNQKSQDGLTAKVMVYVDAENKIRPDYMKVKLTEVPAGFESGDFIQFFRWQANTANQVYVDKIPVQARFETLDGRILTDFSPVIYWAQVSDIAGKSGITDVNTFFQNVRLVVDIRDPQADFDVLKVAMYNSKSENTLNMDVLMPAFPASPSDYAWEKGAPRSAYLQALHPFASMNDQGWTASEFKSMATSFCF